MTSSPVKRERPFKGGQMRVAVIAHSPDRVDRFLIRGEERHTLTPGRNDYAFFNGFTVTPLIVGQAYQVSQDLKNEALAEFSTR